MEYDEIARSVTSVVAEVAELPEEEVWEKRDLHLFDDLQLDSLLALEIVAGLERRYRIQVPEERIVEVTTVSEAIALVRGMLGEAKEAVAS